MRWPIFAAGVSGEPLCWCRKRPGRSGPRPVVAARDLAQQVEGRSEGALLSAYELLALQTRQDLVGTYPTDARVL
jgi:hypothetical protein